MQFVVKFVCIAAVMFFASCHSDVPGLPSAEEIQFCKYKDINGDTQCKSTYEISKADCKALEENGGAGLFEDEKCKVPYEEE